MTLRRRKTLDAAQKSWRKFKASQRNEDLRETVKRREQKREDDIIKRVRAECVERDGTCRLGRDAEMRTKCHGPSEWMHLDENRRFKTMGMDPELRHTALMTMQGCRRHHRQYDLHVFDLVFESQDYANGKFKVVYRDQLEETA